ncbi:retrotransposon hot spot (RHS) protein [Trypanosoma rangeli]|uniref:Retrotransposon hot spot (RHS) protein n=1 Tax=Trypanosoma rangeli TaxID=5698 RepID=A0A422MRY6_TRYRA|nr:retrotransposon hot spot (RHS) protein [Trypanosoma rangeli]RNE95963.1 retrotransposon hot spot (RHS) protein [Trypanosoma rangeli]|eukprot:RNE95963.1 retrotransposon hot spot (RHS) protein [Trypanosoma rangeli]
MDSGARLLDFGGARGMLRDANFLMAPSGISGDGANVTGRQATERGSKQQGAFSGSVEEVLLEGIVGSQKKIQPNDFIRTDFGPTSVVDEDTKCADGGVCAGKCGMRYRPEAS